MCRWWGGGASGSFSVSCPFFLLAVFPVLFVFFAGFHRLSLLGTLRAWDLEAVGWIPFEALHRLRPPIPFS